MTIPEIVPMPMRENIGTTIDITLSQDNPWDYKEYVVLSEQAGVVVKDLYSWCGKTGRLMAAMNLYPDQTPLDAYILLIRELIGRPVVGTPPVSHGLPVPEQDLADELCLPVRNHGNMPPSGMAPNAKGFGDTIAAITSATGLDVLADIYSKITGLDCGCKDRQEALNKLFPYGIKESE